MRIKQEINEGIAELLRDIPDLTDEKCVLIAELFEVDVKTVIQLKNEMKGNTK